jgi:hypothetical protein
MSNLWDKEYIEKEDVEELCKTKEGRREVWLYFMRERITHGLARVFYELGIEIPTTEKQERACEIMWDTILRVPIWQLIEDRELAENLKKSGIKPMGADDLYKMRPKGEA